MKLKKWLTVLLTLAIVLCMIPIRASASGTGNYTVSVVNNDYATGGKSTGSSLSVDKAECLAGETVVITADLKPGTGFYHFDGDEDGPSVWKADASEQLDVVKVSDTVYTFVMPACDVNVAGRFTFLRYTVQLEGFDSGIAGLRNVLTSVNGTTVQNTSPFTAQYGDRIEIDTYGSSQFVVGISYTYTENGQTTTKPVTDIQQPNYDQYVGTFTMPASDVTVSLSKVGTVYLQKGAVTGGTVLLGKDFVIPGDTVTLTGVPSNAALFDPADAVWDIHGTADPSQKVIFTVDPTDPWKVSFVMPSYHVTVDAAFGLDYVATSWNGTEVVTENALCGNPIDLATVTDQEGVTIGDGNWYYVGNDLTIENRLTIRGTANLILCDGATLTLVLGIQLNTFGELNIWGQSAGTGTLAVTKSNDIEDQAGIGGDDGGSAGPLNMHGGKILINGTAEGGAGIGGGRNGNGGTVNVYGGEISVNMERSANGTIYHSEHCAGIGGGNGGSGGTVRIYGGTVYALGGSYGAGIGGGPDGNGGTLEVYGGEVTAKAGINGAGIGGGEDGSGGTVTISGGTVTATSYKGFIGGAGIGGGEGGYGGTVTISGGAVTAKCLGSYAAGIGSGDGYEGKAGIITISGGTVTAYGGVNAAGIGGGEEGAGADVTITGGTVIAYSGNISSSFYDYTGAIGKGSGAGEGADDGSLVIYDTATVYAGAKDSEVSRVTADSRIGSIRTNRYASITPCAHSYGDWTEVDDSTHARHCRYCLGSESGQHTFGDGSVCAVCGAALTYRIVIADSSDGAVTADKMAAAAGETVALTVTPDAGYALWSLYYRTESDSNDPFTWHYILPDRSGAYSFTMPDGNVTVGAYFIPTSGTEYTIAVGRDVTLKNGTVMVAYDSTPVGTLVIRPEELPAGGVELKVWNNGSNGQLIYVELFPDKGYDLVYRNILDGEKNPLGGNWHDESAGEIWLTDSIAEKYITIDPSFKARRSLTLAENMSHGTVTWTVYDSGNGNVSNDPAYAYQNNDVTLTAVPEDGYTFSGWDVKDAGGNTVEVQNNKFSMPDNDVTVGAVFEYTGTAFTVTYKVVNGTWADGSTEDKTETVAGSACPAGVPTGMIAGDGFAGGAWDVDPGDAAISGNTTFTYTFTAIPTFTVTYKVVNGTWADGSTEDKTETVAGSASPAGVPTGMIAGDGFAGGAWDVDPGDAAISGNTTFTYTFTAIPTFTVTYKVVNGTWADGSTENKTETVAGSACPAGVPTGMIADPGFTGGAWDVDPGDAAISGNTTFTYTFTAIPTFTVTYKVVNGTWADGSTEDKTETVAGSACPAGVPTGMIAVPGFTGGAWDQDPSNATISENTTFTYVFEEKNAQPEDPTDPSTDPTGPAESGNLCKWDNVDHGTSFWGRLVHFFHSILYFFARLFGAK